MSSTLLNQIRKTKTKEQYLINLINNFENLIQYCSKKYKNNVNEVFLKESGGSFKFIDSSFEKIKDSCNVDSVEFMFNQNSLTYINILWEIIIKIKYSENHYQISNIFDIHIGEFRFSGEFYWAAWASIMESKYYLIDFDKKNWFSFSDEKYLIDTVHDEYLSNLFYLYKSSKTFEEKESHLSTICKKTVFLFMDNTSPAKTLDFIKLKIGKEKTSLLCGQMHGYFRHTSNDSAGKEAKEWVLFDKQKKKEICEETFIDLLYILAFLRVENLLPEIK